MASQWLTYYIDVNIALFAVASIWALSRFALARVGYRFSFDGEQKLIIASIGFAVLAPAIARGFAAVLPSKLNITDALVAFYLNGGVDMSARQFQSLIGAKSALVEGLTGLNSGIMYAATIVSLSAIVLFLARLIFNALHLREIIQHGFMLKNVGRLKLLASDKIDVPFTTRGLRHFYVVVPVEMLGDAWKTRIAIAHELQHVRNGDVTWEYLWSLCQPLLFWNPAFYLFRKRLNVLRELICDAALLAKPAFNKRRYCETLLSVARQMSQIRSRHNALAVPFVEPKRYLARKGQSSLEYRILYALELPSVRDRKLLANAAMWTALLATALLVIMLLQQPGAWSHERIMLSTIANLEHLQSLNSASK
jgi:beta-lactamase regulating signal transducer with metallopeptidase domain